jgi:hypothetical protein
MYITVVNAFVKNMKEMLQVGGQDTIGYDKENLQEISP